MSWVGRGASTVALTVMAFTTVGCASEGDGVNSESLCVSDFVYEGRTYKKLSNAEFEVGQKLGTATNPSCHDTNDQAAEEPATTENAYAVSGISSDLAIAIGSSPEQATVFTVLRSDKKIPPEVQELLDGS